MFFAKGFMNKVPPKKYFLTVGFNLLIPFNEPWKKKILPLLSNTLNITVFLLLLLF